MRINKLETTYTLKHMSDMLESINLCRSSLSADGEYLVISPFIENRDISWRGTTYIYKRSGDVWTQQTKLVASDPATGDQFGWSVSISSDGGYAVVGAQYKTGTYDYQGAAYIFLRSGTTWTQQAKLLASDPAAYDQFGCSVSISGDGSYAIVGAYGKTGTYTQQGAAYIFLRSGTTWAQQARLSCPDDSEDTYYFGQNVCIDDGGEYAVVTAEHRQNGRHDRHLIFHRSGALWSKQAELRPKRFKNVFWRSYRSCISRDGRHVILLSYPMPGILGAVEISLYARMGSAWVFVNDIVSGTAADEDLAQTSLVGG